MSLSELETLRRLRRHRADRAERTLREQARQQQGLLAQIEHAQDALEQARQQQTLQTAQLLREYQGHVVSRQTLTSWAARERALFADTRCGEDRLRALHGQNEAKVIDVNNAQKLVSQCLRQVEKLHELAALLQQEAL